MFHLHPLLTLLRDYFDMRVDRTSKVIPLSSPVIRSALEFWSRRDLVSQGVPLQPLPPSYVTYGLGAVCGPLTARGVWSSDQFSLHINFPELETVFLALKTFQRWLCGAHVLVQTDSTTVMHYVNRAGGTRSRSLDYKVREIILWCLSMRITLSAVHISGQDNVEADRLSRFRIENPHRLERSTKWSFDRRVTNLLFDIWGLPTVDLFASRLNNKVEAFFSCLPDPLALQGNTLQADWPKGLLYMYPPVPLLSFALHKVIREEAQVIAILAWWLWRGWFPLVLQLLVDLPVMLPKHDGLLLAPDGTGFLDLGGTPPSCLETLGRSLRSRGVLREAAATISAAHRPSTRALYHAKWQTFCRWCYGREKDPFHPSIRMVLSYLQHLRHRRLNMLSTPLFLAIYPPLVLARTRLMGF